MIGRVDYVSVDALFGAIGLVDNETGTNDTLVTATTLETTTGFLPNTRYELQSALSSATDRDLFAFQAPDFANSTLAISVDPVGTTNPELDVILLNANGDRIATELTRKPDGGLSLVANAVANENYVLFVRTATGSLVKQGNYVATINFATDPADELLTVFSGSVNATGENVSKFTTYKTQLFRFDLTAQSTTANAGVQLNVFDARTGNIVSSFATASGEVRTSYVWLGAGEYYFVATSRSRVGTPLRAGSFSLVADVISDDQGPNPIDPTLPPPPTLPDWDWESASPTDPTIIDFVEPPLEDPWTSDFDYGFFEDFYQEFLA